MWDGEREGVKKREIFRASLTGPWGVGNEFSIFYVALIFPRVYSHQHSFIKVLWNGFFLQRFLFFFLSIVKILNEKVTVLVCEQQTKKKSESENVFLHFSNPNFRLGKAAHQDTLEKSEWVRKKILVMTLDVVARYDIFISFLCFFFALLSFLKGRETWTEIKLNFALTFDSHNTPF